MAVSKLSRRRMDAAAGVAAWLLASVLTGCHSARYDDRDALRQAVRASLDVDHFDPRLLDDNATSVIATKDGEAVFSRAELSTFLSFAHNAPQVYQASDLKFISVDTSPKAIFGSVDYGVTWTVTLPGMSKPRTTRMTSHEIWERQTDGWHRLFAATSPAE